MGGPTWSPDQTEGPGPEVSDTEFERRWLSPLLLAGSEANGGVGARSSLAPIRRQISLWLHMMSGRPWPIGHSDPPTCDGSQVFLPPFLPPTLSPEADCAAYRCMALLQTQLAGLGLLERRAWMAELHSDWVLQVTSHLLMANWVVARWTALPGMTQDLSQLQEIPALLALRVGRSVVPTKGLPSKFAPLLTGLKVTADGGCPDIAAQVRLAVETPFEALALVIPGIAQRLREQFKEARLGAPPVPAWVGVLHPGWFLDDAATAHRAANEWRKGPAPLRQLLKMAKSKSKTTGEARPSERWDVPPTRENPEEDLRYDEWDCHSSIYRVGAVRVHAVEPDTAGTAIVDQILDLHATEIAATRDEFARLRTEARWLHGQVDGSEFDLDRLVTATADIRAGQRPDQHLYLRYQETPQPLVVLTLVDLSGSTQGRVLREQQKALVFFEAALSGLDVPHSFVGFNGRGAHDCRAYTIQAFGEPFEAAKKRIAGLNAKGGSRLGGHLRHAGHLLAGRSEARKILLVLSDGRPEDGEAYRGEVGIVDTAMAIRELRGQGVHAHCISMDSGEAPYLRSIFGDAGYTQVDACERLPRRLATAFQSLVR